MLRQALILLVLLLATFSFIPSAKALPIDWHGVFGVDTTMIDSYRRVKARQENQTTNLGSQEVPLAAGEKRSASFQTYIFRLNPVIIVNDSASLFGEITSGYARGGRLGEDPTQNKQGDFANALYMYNVSSSDNDLVLNKFYAEIYADTATYVLGRHSSDWGLGAVVNSGGDAWDRHAFVRDGITMKVRLGNFRLEPYWAKIGSESSLTRSHRLREYGISLLYDNLDRDLGFGLLYSVKSASAFEDTLSADVNNTGRTFLTNSEVKLLDIYFRKSFGDLNVELEVPMLSDSLGDLFSTGSPAKIKGKAYLLESSYKINNSWSVFLKGGNVSGDAGSGSSFDAMYLNPNYQIANLLFRYNLRAVSDPNNINVFDSYITNSTFFKLGGVYSTEKWTWEASFIYAFANEVATAGQHAFNHERNKRYLAQQTQDKDLGYEIDIDFNYQWNNEISIGGSAGYLFTGDYFAFTNDPSKPNETNNSFVLQLRTAIEF